MAKTYETTGPENDPAEPVNELRNWMGDCMSPSAVAAIAAHLLAAKTNDAGVNREVAWFTNTLIDMLGTAEYARLCDELGL